MINLYLWRRCGVGIVGGMILMSAAVFALAADPIYRVVTFGDSTTANRGKVKNYSAQLAEKFPNIEIINKGVGGHTTAMAAKRFQTDVLDQKPNLVVIQFGINDAAVDVWKIPPATSVRVSLADYEKNLRQFIEEIRKGGSEVILMTPNQVRWTPKMLEMYGKPPYNPEDPQGFTAILSGYAECVRKLAAELKVPLVDVYAFYDTPERHASSCTDLLVDGIHPSEKGHALVARELAVIIESKVPTHAENH